MVIPNELLWIGFLLLDLALALVVYRYFGKQGLLLYVVISLIAANLQVQKLVVIFGLTTTLGNVLYGSIFFCTDLLSERHGKKAAQQAVWFGFIALILVTVYMQVALLFAPAGDDYAQAHMAVLYGFLPRIALGSLIAYLLSQFSDIWLFHRIRQATKGRMLWLRNNASTLVSQGLDTVVFTLIAFAPISLLNFGGGEMMPWAVVWQIMLTTYIMKLIVALLDTPFLYLGRIVGKLREKQSGNGNALQQGA